MHRGYPHVNGEGIQQGGWAGIRNVHILFQRSVQHSGTVFMNIKLTNLYKCAGSVKLNSESMF